jgi:hypothetical protein
MFYDLAVVFRKSGFLIFYLLYQLNFFLTEASCSLFHQGSECEYRHSEYARVNPRDCYFWLNGNCMNPKCGFRHPVSLFFSRLVLMLCTSCLICFITLLAGGKLFNFASPS